MKRGAYKITPEHIDDMVLKHIELRNSMGVTGVRPAEAGRRDHERKEAKKDQQALAPKPEKEPEMKDGYCLNCKGKKKFESDSVHHHASGVVQHHGKCPDCGGRMVSHFESKGEGKSKAKAGKK